MTAGARACIYCGADEKLTSEHVFGDWTRKYVERTYQKYSFQSVIAPSPGQAVGKPVKIRAGDPLNSQIKAVCAKCNSGWMSQIQERAKPFLIPLFEGSPRVLGRDAQRRIATWASLASMTAEFISRDPVDVSIPQFERAKIMARSRPSNSFRVWIGKYEREKWGGQWRHGTIPIYSSNEIEEASRGAHAPNHQTTSFTIGKLFVHVFSGHFRHIIARWDWQNALRALSALKQIWPIENNVVHWPGTTMTDADAQLFSNAFILRSEQIAAKAGWYSFSGEGGNAN